MCSDNNERDIGSMAITSHSVRTVYEIYFKNEYVDFFGTFLQYDESKGF